MVERTPEEEAKNECLRKLAEAGASPELSKFYVDAMEYEFDMTHTIYRLQSELRTELARTTGGCLAASVLYEIIRNMTKYFHAWKLKIDSLSKAGSNIPPFQFSSTLSNLEGRPQSFKAVCSLETNELNVEEGEEMVITDASHPNWLRVRNSRGDEGYVPAMSCILPTPDNSALTAVERLEILLLTSWTDCIRKLKSLLNATLTSSSQAMTSQWATYLVSHRDAYDEKVGIRFKRIIDMATRTPDSLDLNRLHKTLCRLESDLIAINSSNGLSSMTVVVANLDRSVLCFQTFYNQWRQFRRTLSEAPRPIKMVDQWDQLRRASQCRHFKYYEMKMTLEELETLEEITYITALADNLMTSSTSGQFRRESVESDELTAITQEEKKRFVIRAVVDPRTNQEISFLEAIRDGVVDTQAGMHRNPTSGDGVSIAEAMTLGLIDVERTSVQVSAPKVDCVALITIRRRTDRQYTLTGARDALTGETVDIPEAQRRKLLDEDATTFFNQLSGASIPLEQALNDGWVLADYDDSSPEYACVTYVIIAVVDVLGQRPLSFVQALKRGLIDRETGNFVNNKTGKKIYLPAAIEQGLVKVRQIPENADLLTDIHNLSNNLIVNDRDREAVMMNLPGTGKR